MDLSRSPVDRVRRQTPGAQHVVHLNNAGCALPPRAVLDAQTEYLHTEALVGGYERADQLEASGVDPYSGVARLLGADAGEIGLCQSATEAWRRVVYALPMTSGAVVAFDESTYGSNVLALLDGQHRFDWQLRPVDLGAGGSIDIDKLSTLLRTETVSLVALTHMPAQSGVVNPVGEVVRLVHEAGGLVLLDACQTLGQVPIDVRASSVDALVFTGRKYLRGPRGTGGYFLRKSLLPDIRPLGPDIRGAEIVDQQMTWRVHGEGRSLEQWERSWVGVAGLAAAAEYLSCLDSSWVWDRIRHLAMSVVQELEGVDGVTVRRRADEQGGIVVFDVPGYDLRALRDQLRAMRVNVMFAGPQNAPVEMYRRQERGWLRASVHYFNTDEDVTALGAALRACLAARS